MIQVGSIFTQVLSLVNRNDFARAVRQWDAEHGTRFMYIVPTAYQKQSNAVTLPAVFRFRCWLRFDFYPLNQYTPQAVSSFGGAKLWPWLRASQTPGLTTRTPRTPNFLTELKLSPENPLFRLAKSSIFL